MQLRRNPSPGSLPNNPVSIHPVIYLGIERDGLPLTGKAGELAETIRERSTYGGYLPTEGGFYVPLLDLIGYLTGLAEYLYEETVYNSRFEIGGSLIFSNREGLSLPAPPRSSFRLAMNMVDSLIALREGETRRVYLSPVEPWQINRRGTMTGIETPEIAFIAPTVDLIAAAQDATVQIRQFAGRISPLLLAFKDPFITDEVIRTVFGFKD